MLRLGVFACARPRLAPQFFACCSPGLEGVLQHEIARELGIAKEAIGLSRAGCSFTGESLAVGMQAVMHLRSATRVLELLGAVETPGAVGTPKELYDFVYECVEWERAVSARAGSDGRKGVVDSDSLLSVAVDVTGGKRAGDEAARHEQQSGPMSSTDSQFLALKVKDAIVDRARDRLGARPNVEKATAGLPVVVHHHDGCVWVYRSLTGHNSSLHKRGYKEGPQHKAGLNESVAAGLLLASGWHEACKQPGAVLCDPLCGGGTFLVEAALMATNTAPLLANASTARATTSQHAPHRPPNPKAPQAWFGDKWCSFMLWESFDEGAWQGIVEKARASALDAQQVSGQVRILGNDHHPGSIALSKRALQRSGMSPLVRFLNEDVGLVAPMLPAVPTLIVANPPYNLRLDNNAEESWKGLAAFARQVAQRKRGNVEMWVLSGNPRTARAMQMRSERESMVEVVHAHVKRLWLKFCVFGGRRARDRRS